MTLRFLFMAPIVRRPLKFARVMGIAGFVLLSACSSQSENPPGSGGVAGTGAASGEGGQAGWEAGSDGSIQDGAMDGNANPGPSPACGYQEAQSLVVSCSGSWTQGTIQQAREKGSLCPDYVDILDTAVMDSGGLDAIGCDSSCVYIATESALIMHCGRKGEVTYHADGGLLQTNPMRTCPELFYFHTIAGSGWYTSQEVFEAEHPCP